MLDSPVTTYVGGQSLVEPVMTSFCAVHFLDELLDLIESVSEGFPTYSYYMCSNILARGQTSNEFVQELFRKIGFSNARRCGQIMNIKACTFNS